MENSCVSVQLPLTFTLWYFSKGWLENARAHWFSRRNQLKGGPQMLAWYINYVVKMTSYCVHGGGQKGPKTCVHTKLNAPSDKKTTTIPILLWKYCFHFLHCARLVCKCMKVDWFKACTSDEIRKVLYVLGSMDGPFQVETNILGV